jgi:hypothetical protein
MEGPNLGPEWLWVLILIMSFIGLIASVVWLVKLIVWLFYHLHIQ